MRDLRKLMSLYTQWQVQLRREDRWLNLLTGTRQLLLLKEHRLPAIWPGHGVSI